MTLVQSDTWTPQGVPTLEDRAWEALRENERSVCVTAGAGAGKTEFLAQKASYLLQTGICPHPKRILAISFKKDAARNLADRVARRCTPEQARRFDSMTFDAFTKSFIDRFRAAIPEPWSPTLDYRIVFPFRRDFDAFLRANGFGGLNAQQLERRIARSNLPLTETDSAALREYWRSELHDHGESWLSFPMINRLVVYLLRTNPKIRRALQITYPFVFLDEFQDTTYAQFELVHSAFDGSDTIFTAVGDDKQRIMGWAGAMQDAFQRFEDDFAARRISLLSNWRSHPELVAIQHVIAQQIDPESEPPESRADRSVDGDIAAIWHYESADDEIVQLSAWIAAEIQSGIEPHEIAILVRMKPNDVEELFREALADEGVQLRNIVRNVGDIAIQDLLSEELTEILLCLLRLGASARNPEAWTKAQLILQYLEAISPQDDAGQSHLQERLQDFVRVIRPRMTGTEPDPDTAREFAQAALDFVGESTIRQGSPAYQRDTDYNRVWDGFNILLAESASSNETWAKSLDRFEGIGQVMLMTVHKSKGLEFHTMIFYGLDNQTWWSLKAGNAEELNSFFVAFTRAKQRAFFTYCAERGGPVGWIERILQPAGLKRVHGPA